MPSEEIDLGQRVKETREYLGMSQAYVAERTGLPRSAISDIERGLRKVSTIELKRLADAFGVSRSYFLGEDGHTDDTEEVRVLTRLAGELSDDERAELIQFARFLRHSSGGRRRKP